MDYMNTALAERALGAARAKAIELVAEVDGSIILSRLGAHDEAAKRNRVLIAAVKQKIQADHVWIYEVIANCRARSEARR